MVYYGDEGDWYCKDEKEKNRTREVLEWTEKNAKVNDWEVWT